MTEAFTYVRIFIILILENMKLLRTTLSHFFNTKGAVLALMISSCTGLYFYTYSTGPLFNSEKRVSKKISLKL